jgi:hypothetical protein
MSDEVFDLQNEDGLYIWHKIPLAAARMDNSTG